MYTYTLTLGLIIVLLTGCQPGGPTPPLRELTLSAETTPGVDSTLVHFDRGVIKVPVNRRTLSERTWDVEFVRFKRSENASPDTPPLFILRGGPGTESGTQLLEDPRYYDYFIAPYVEITDVIMPGQRGFQTSGATACEPMEALFVQEALEENVRRLARRQALDLCREKWQSLGIDLKGFNVVEMAADVYDIARGLGYDKIQIMGQSFGSHLGMALLRNHPDILARATLSGLEGPDHTYDMPGHVVAALERIAESAEASPELAPHIPEGGLLAAYQELIHQADENPIPISIEDPENGRPVLMALDGDDLRSLTRGYSRGTNWRYIMPAWPLDVLTMLNGDFTDAAYALADELTFPRMREAAYYQIDCASGISEDRGAILRSDPAADLIGKTWEFYDTDCAAWDADLGDKFRSAFTTDVPTLMVQGNWDTSTPYENALELRPFFTNHRFVHIEGGSHGALREASEDVDGFRDQFFEWLSTGSYDQLPERIELPPMRWRAPQD